MITSKNRISRRSLLRGASGVAIGLPFLSAMLRPGVSFAQDTPLRFLVFYSPGGTLLDRWRPSGSETNFQLSDMMSPLAPHTDKLVFVDGVNLDVTRLGFGHPHARGMGGVLTGQPLLNGNFNTNEGSAGFADGISVDQVIAERLSAGLRLKSLELSTAWSTGITSGGSHPGNQLTYAGSNQPIPPSTDPLATFNRVFADVGTSEEPAGQGWDANILDAVAGEYRALSQQLGAEDREKLDAHLSLVEEAQSSLDAVVRSDCSAPDTINQTPGYYEDGAAQGVSRGELDGGPEGVGSGFKVPEKGAAMTDLMVAAMACDITRVGTMQWGDSEAKFMMPFLSEADGTPLADHHHGYQHDRGFQPEALAIIHKWYAENLATLLSKMDAIQEGNGMSLLDNTLVFWITEIQSPGDHGQGNMPFVLAGGAAGGLQTGRWLDVPSQPHNNLLVSILNYFGFDETHFGHPDFGSGPLSGLI